MSEFADIRTLAQLKQIDTDDAVRGYLSGLNSESAPGSDKSPSFCHGWKNGRVDAGLAQPDAAQRALVKAYLAACSPVWH